MEFFEAAEIAKARPGSTLTRSEAGAFVVRLVDGTQITSPGDLRAPEPPASTRSDQQHETVEYLLNEARDLRRTIHIARSEIDRLRLEVNAIKATLSRIPSTEWARFEGEQERLAAAERATHKRQLVEDARAGKLSLSQLSLVADNAGGLGLTTEEYEFVASEVRRLRPPIPVVRDGLVVHATTKGQ